MKYQSVCTKTEVFCVSKIASYNKYIYIFWKLRRLICSISFVLDASKSHGQN